MSGSSWRTWLAVAVTGKTIAAPSVRGVPIVTFSLPATRVKSVGTVVSTRVAARPEIVDWSTAVSDPDAVRVRSNVAWVTPMSDAG